MNAVLLMIIIVLAKRNPSDYELNKDGVKVMIRSKYIILISYFCFNSNIRVRIDIF